MDSDCCAKALYGKQPESPVLKEYTTLLYDQAMLMMGARPDDPARFIKNLTNLMVENIKDGG